MAPRKVKVDALPARYSPALDAPNMSEKNLAATRLMTAVEGSEMGVTELRAGSAERQVDCASAGSLHWPSLPSEAQAPNRGASVGA